MSTQPETVSIYDKLAEEVGGEQIVLFNFSIFRLYLSEALLLYLRNNKYWVNKSYPLMEGYNITHPAAGSQALSEAVFLHCHNQSRAAC